MPNTTQMNLVDIMLSDISQSQIDKYCIILHEEPRVTETENPR